MARRIAAIVIAATTAEGIHLGAMAGTVDLVQRVSTGIEMTGDILRINPKLPWQMGRLDMRIRYRGQSLDLKLTREAFTVSARERDGDPIKLQVQDEVFDLEGGGSRVFPIGT